MSTVLLLSASFLLLSVNRVVCMPRPRHVVQEGPFAALLVTGNVPLINSSNHKYHANLTHNDLNTTVDLLCMPQGLLPRHTSLQWWEEMAPVVEDMRREIQQEGCGLRLRIHRFVMEDYGRYKCKCVQVLPSFEHGIPGFIDRIWPRETVIGTEITLLPNYPETSAQFPRVKVHTNSRKNDSLISYAIDYLPLTQKITQPLAMSESGHTDLFSILSFSRANPSLRCGSMRRQNNTLWTRITDNTTELYSVGSVVSVQSRKVNTKLMCHDQSQLEVYSVHYVPAATPRRIRNQHSSIVYPPSDVDYVNYQYLPEMFGERDIAINLCLIQPYINQLTRAKLLYKRGDRTVRVDGASSTQIFRTRTVSVSLQSKVLHGIHTGLLYYVNIEEPQIMTNDSMTFLKQRLENAQFSCALGRDQETRVNFKLNLTQSTFDKHVAKAIAPHVNSNLTCHIKWPKSAKRGPNLVERNYTVRSVTNTSRGITTTFNDTPSPTTQRNYTTIEPTVTTLPFRSLFLNQSPIPIVVSLIVAGTAVIVLVLIGVCCIRAFCRKRVSTMRKVPTPTLREDNFLSSSFNPLFGMEPDHLEFSLVCLHVHRSYLGSLRSPDPYFLPLLSIVPSLQQPKGKERFAWGLETTIQSCCNFGLTYTHVQRLKSEGLFYPSSLLTLFEDLGSGAFGIVKKAELYDPVTQTVSTVAVKMLKDSTTLEDKKDIIMELKTLLHIGKHQNLLCLLGASVYEGKLCLLVEYCEHGNLLEFLRSKRGDVTNSLTDEDMIEMAVQIANGMSHLTSKKCIHRDLAARNVLITADFTLKVADFGLARKIYHSVYRPSAKRLPIKWMAPEGILDGVCTSKSDVWSFGVVLWEIFTLGRTPYPGISAHSVISVIVGGYRMPQPNICPDRVYSLMRCCWQLDSRLRPDFTELMVNLEALLWEKDTNSLQNTESYYNVQSICRCDDRCSDCADSLTESNQSAFCVGSTDDRDYVNVLPRGWFGDTNTGKDQELNEIFQAHINQETGPLSIKDCGSLCSVCVEQRSFLTGSLSFMSFDTDTSLCTVRKAEQEHFSDCMDDY